MPQVLKREVRDRIEIAALQAFAERGYVAATMTDIARRAGVVPANVYRYYKSKEALFDAVAPASKAEELTELLALSVQQHAPVAQNEPPEAGAGEALVEFWLSNRQLVILLLTQDGGTPHQGFGQRFVRSLVAMTVQELRRLHPELELTREQRLVLHSIFDNTRRTIASLLASCPTEAALRSAIAGFRRYQTGGLASFTRWALEGRPR